MTGVLKSVANYLFDTLAQAIDSKVKFRLGDVVDIADIDRGVYRVVAGGTGIPDGVNYIDLDNGYQLELIYGHKATVDVTDYQACEINSLIGSSGMTIKANTLEKTSGSAGWNEQVYSQNFFTGGARIAFQAAQTNANMMIGLNTDPQTDANYTSIDYAIYTTASGIVNIYESGVSIGAFGTYLVGSLLEIRYDGENINYYVDDVLKRTVFAGTGINFFFDSSFNTVNAKATHIRFEHYFDSTSIDYEATEINTFVSVGNILKKGAEIKKTGSDSWGTDQVYSQNYFKGGAQLKFRSSTTDKIYAMGLNTDPLTSGHYNTIDYCFYLGDTGTLYIFESGTQIGTYGSYTADTLLEVIYDGYEIKYYKDGTLQRSVANAYDIIFYFDSAFYSFEAEAKNVWFGHYTNPELTGGAPTTYHYHATDRARANHTGTQTAATISDFDTEVANNSAVTLNTGKVSNATHTGDVTGSTALTIANDAVTIPKLSATGTPSAVNFHCGDDTWKSITGSPVSDGAYSRASWNGDTAQAATRNAISDEFYSMLRYTPADTGGADCIFIGKSINTVNIGAYNTYLGHLTGAVNLNGTQNVGIGSYVLQNNISGSYNIGIGLDTLKSNISGSYNIGIGKNALIASQVASYNTAIGAESLYSLATDGTNNVAVGYQSLYSANDANADYNVAIGNYSLYTLLSGFGNVSIGARSGYGITSGGYNFCGGTNAGDGLTTGSYNCFTGYQSGYAADFRSGTTAYGAETLTSGFANTNTAIGRRAMYVKLADISVAVGGYSMGSSTVGQQTTGSVAVGNHTLENVNGGDYNTAIGFRSGDAVSSGDYNLYLGYQAGDNMTIGSYNICLGYQANGTASSSYTFAVASNNGNYLFGSMATNPYLRVYGNLEIAAYGVTRTPPYNYHMVIQATSNTNAQIAYKGSDGVVRTANFPLT